MEEEFGIPSGGTRSPVRGKSVTTRRGSVHTTRLAAAAHQEEQRQMLRGRGRIERTTAEKAEKAEKADKVEKVDKKAGKGNGIAHGAESRITGGRGRGLQ